MSGRRLLDVAALFNASRGVAQKHIALRSKQLDLWSKSSSVAKAIKSQTDRVTQTVRAASFLSARLNDNTPIWAGEDQRSTVERAEISWERTTGREGQTLKGDLEQKRSYAIPSSDTSTVPSCPEPKDILQESRDEPRRHLNDKLAQAYDQDIFYRPLGYVSATVLKQMGNTRGDHGNIQGIDSNLNPNLSAPAPKQVVLGVEEQEQVPEGINIDLFHSPRVAEKLHGRIQTIRKTELKADITEECLAGQDTRGPSTKLDSLPPPAATKNIYKPSFSILKDKNTTGLVQGETNANGPDLAASDVSPPSTAYHQM